jgi:hypothetical protein
MRESCCCRIQPMEILAVNGSFENLQCSERIEEDILKSSNFVLDDQYRLYAKCKP